jgi:glycerophosphoryl diester phosphodiesterase
LGADGVELDVRRSRDHAMVIHHDAELADGRPIHDVTVADLPEPIALLGAALDACDGLTVNIEIKNVPVDIDFDPEHYLAGAVVSLLNERDPAGDRAHGFGAPAGDRAQGFGAPAKNQFVVSCFNLDTIDRVRQLDSEIPTGYLASPAWEQLEALRRGINGGHGAFHPHHVVVNAELVGAAHDSGVAINVWTVDDPDRIRWLAELGVDAVITNVPDVAIDALRRG